MTTTRLETIATRQRIARVRDLAFAVLIVLAGGVALSSVSTGAHAARATAADSATPGATGQTSVTAR